MFIAIHAFLQILKINKEIRKLKEGIEKRK